MKSNFWNHVNRIQRAFASSVCMPVKRLKYSILVLKKAWKNECGRNVVVLPKVPWHFWAAQLSNTDWVHLLFSSSFFFRNLYKRHDSAPLRVYTMLNEETIASLLAMTHLPCLFPYLCLFFGKFKLSISFSVCWPVKMSLHRLHILQTLICFIWLQTNPEIVVLSWSVSSKNSFLFGEKQWNRGISN